MPWLRKNAREIAAGVCRDFPHYLDNVLWIPKQRGEKPSWASTGVILVVGPEHGLPLN